MRIRDVTYYVIMLEKVTRGLFFFVLQFKKVG